MITKSSKIVFTGHGKEVDLPKPRPEDDPPDQSIVDPPPKPPKPTS